MSNIYLNAFSCSRKRAIPTPRLRALLGEPNISVCEQNVMYYDLSKGMIPFYKIDTSMLYKIEKSYLSLPRNYNMFFCLPASNRSISLGSGCDNDTNWLQNLFGLDHEKVEEVCIKYVGNVNGHKVSHFCSTWDKSFHLLQSIVRVQASSNYDLTEKQKEIFSMCWAKALATSRIRMDLECSVDIQEIGVSAPLWLQQFSKGVVILDTPNKMISNSLVSDMSTFLNKSYEDLKNISLKMCKSFLVDMREKPDYKMHQEKIDGWIQVCDKMGSRSKINKKLFSASLIFGIIGAVVLLKRASKAA